MLEEITPWFNYAELYVDLLKSTTCKDTKSSKDGVSAGISHVGLVFGYDLPNYNALTLEFGCYIQIFDDQKITNTQDTCSTGTISLGQDPSPNRCYDFMSVHT